MSDPGNDAKTFMQDTMAPLINLIKPGTKAYDELKRDIFGREERSGRAVRKRGGTAPNVY